MTILITGATGFIGRELIAYISKFENTTIIASSSGRTKFVNTSTNVIYKPANIETIYKTEDKLFDYFNKPDILIHLAWKGLPNFKEEFHVSENLEHNFNFIDKLVKQGLKNVNVLGTCLEYGLSEGEQIETKEVKPTTNYAIAKLSLYNRLQSLETNFSLKWIRLFYIYGSNQNPNSLYPSILKAVKEKPDTFNMSNGEQKRDFIRIEKAIKSIYKIALQKKYLGIINCSDGKGTKVIDFVNHFFEAENYSPKLNKSYYSIPDYEPFEFWGNNEKLKKILLLPDE